MEFIMELIYLLVQFILNIDYYIYKKLKKIAIFTVQQNLSIIEFIKLLISPNNFPNEKDILTAQIMLKSGSLKYRINDLEKKINFCKNNAKNLIQKGNKNGAKPCLIRK